MESYLYKAARPCICLKQNKFYVLELMIYYVFHPCKRMKYNNR